MNRIRRSVLILGIATATLLMSMNAAAQEDSEGVKIWWERYQSAGQLEARWDPLVLAGIRLWMAGKPREALEPIEEALGLGCESPVVKLIHGHALYGADANADDVVKSLNDALTAAGEEPQYGFIRMWALKTLGLHYEGHGQYEEALDSYSRAEAVTGEDVTSRHRKEAAEGAARCRGAIVLNAAALPPNASKEQVRTYVEQVLTDAPVMPDGDDDLRVRKLVRIGADNLDVLLELNLELSVPGALHLEAATKQLVGPEHKALVLKWLPRQEQLSTIVFAQGWAVDAKDILLQGLAERNWSLPPDWIRAAASLREPASYEDLRWQLVNGHYSRETYEAIKNIPEIGLKQALMELWEEWEAGRRGVPRSESKPGTAAICIEEGVPGALEYVIDSLDVDWKYSFYREATARTLTLRFTEATGTNDELRRWFRQNRQILVFDEEARKFRVPEGVNPDDFPESPERLAAYRKADAMRMARGIRAEFGDDVHTFTQAFQSVADLLPVIPVAIDQDPPEPFNVLMSVHGEGTDAVIVRAPVGKPRDMIWVFTVPNAQVNWFILPVEGVAGRGFDSYHGSTDARDGKSMCLYQYLSAERIEPGKEYILWFEFEDRAPTDVQLAVRFVPPGSVEDSLDALKTALRCDASWNLEADL